MRKESRIGFIGSGVMAEAMIKGMLRENVTSASQIIASGPRQERGKQLADKYGIAVTNNNAEAVDQADIVVLSLKPQMLSTVLEELSGKIMKDALVLSIVAGATIEKIELGLNHKSVVRSMPNTPAQIRKGISAWTATPEADRFSTARRSLRVSAG